MAKSTLVLVGSIPAALPVFDYLSSQQEVGVVITMPDRPRGRGQKLVPGPVAAWTRERGFRLSQPENRAELEEVVGSLREIGLGMVIGYGMIIPSPLIERFGGRLLNLHFSILPRWRGAAPVQHALLAGDVRTGVTLMQINESLDTGPVVATYSTAIGSEEDCGTLTDRLSRLGVELCRSLGERLYSGEWIAVPQPEEGISLAPKISRSDFELDLSASAAELVRKVKALSPRPGAYVNFDSGRLKVVGATVLSEDTSGRSIPVPGLWDISGGIGISTGDGYLQLDQVQPTGKRVMSAADWWRGLSQPPTWTPSVQDPEA